MNKRKLFFILTTVVLLVLTACEGSFRDPNMNRHGGGFASGGDDGNYGGGGSGGGNDGNGGNGGNDGNGGNGGGGSEVSGTVTINQNKRLYLRYHNWKATGAVPDCKITTDLPSPDDSFTIKDLDDRWINGLTPGLEVNFTAKVERGSIEFTTDDYGNVAAGCAFVDLKWSK